MVNINWIGAAPFIALVACNVSEATRSTGGAALGDAAPGVTDSGGADGGAVRSCPRAFAVVSSDYTSTNVSVTAPDGKVLSESAISSGSAPAGLTTALSGDVVLPRQPPRSGRLVLIDRYPNSVVTWIDPKTAQVLHQLSVGTGFGANPHDYLEVSDTKAYVSRYEPNPKAGAAAYDAGSDVLVLDTKSFTITGEVKLAASDDGVYLPRPDRLLGVGGEAWVLLERLNADFSAGADGRVVGIDAGTDARAWTLDLPGVASCGGLTRSPAGSVVAVSCTGVLSDPDPAKRSAVVLLDATAHPPVELRRFPVAAALHAPVGPSLAFAREKLLVGVAFGDTQTKRNDVAFTLDLDTGETKQLIDAGAAFVLGDFVCTPGCGDLCLLADAQRNALKTWRVEPRALIEQPDVSVDPTVGLPPRAIGPL